MGPVDAVRRALSRYVTFSGRARRPEYWWFVMFGAVAGLIATGIDILIGTGTTDGGVVNAIVSLALLPPYLAVSWRRLHDVELSGWNLFLVPIAMLPVTAAAGLSAMQAPLPSWLVPGLLIAGAITTAGVSLWLLWMFVSPGTPGPNRYGHEPKP